MTKEVFLTFYRHQLLYRLLLISFFKTSLMPHIFYQSKNLETKKKLPSTQNEKKKVARYASAKIINNNMQCDKRVCATELFLSKCWL